MTLVLVVTALLLGMAAKGLTLFDQSKADQLLLQVRQMESLMNEYKRTHHRWPGDCDGNGQIDSSMTDFVGAIAENARSIRAEHFEFTATSPVASSESVNGDPAVAGNACPIALPTVHSGELTPTVASGFNVPYNDLKLAGLLSVAQPNRIAAMHAAGDFMAMTKLGLGSPLSGSDPYFNAIVLFNVSVSFSRKLAVALDGFDGAEAYKGRLRRIRVSGDGFETSWVNNSGVTNETQDSLINVAYFFDQMPLPQTY
ncbi:MAG: hypothetical protein HQ445_13965 [Polaromonas sp.]|nr:hypothetical protein [Polaromonas sp.]